MAKRPTTAKGFARVERGLTMDHFGVSAEIAIPVLLVVCGIVLVGGWKLAKVLWAAISN